MGPGYAKSAREHAPQAIIAIDPFHIVALANRALADVRRAYCNKLRELDDPDAADGSRTPAGRCSKPPTASQTNRAQRSERSGPPPARRGAPTPSQRRCARSSSPASRSRTPRSRSTAPSPRRYAAAWDRASARPETIRRHRDAILQAIRLGINQGRTEAPNNKARLNTRRAPKASTPPPRSHRSCSPADRSRFQPPPTSHRPESPTSMPREPCFRPALTAR